MYYKICLFASVNIKFEKTTYSVYEDDGLLTVVLSLDKPALKNFSVQVIDANVTTNSKSYRVHVLYMHT